jgi:hypothetical protein
MRIIAQMSTMDEVSADLARVTVTLGERLAGTGSRDTVISDGTARAIASWYASPRHHLALTALSQGATVHPGSVEMDIRDARAGVPAAERYPLDLLMAWVRDRHARESDD